jgi:hypothetical protein
MRCDRLNIHPGGEKVYKPKATALDLAGLMPLNFKKNGKVTVSE